MRQGKGGKYPGSSAEAGLRCTLKAFSSNRGLFFTVRGPRKDGGGVSLKIPEEGGVQVGARNRYHLSLVAFFPQFYSTFGRDVTFSLVLKAFQVGLGSWNPEFTICPFRARIWPFQAPKTLRFKGKMANIEAKKTIKQGKTPEGQMVPISRVYRVGLPGEGCLRGIGEGCQKMEQGPLAL